MEYHPESRRVDRELSEQNHLLPKFIDTYAKAKRERQSEKFLKKKVVHQRQCGLQSEMT